MKGSGKSIAQALAFELTPSAIFGSAIGFASATVLGLPRVDTVPLFAGGAAFALSCLLLRRFGAEAKSLPLADFNQSELEREFAALAEEMQQAESDELVLEDVLPSLVEDELLLEDELTSPEADSRVIRLFDPKTQTAGEMQERIDQHLRTTPRPPLSDATQELHEAIAALRQSLR